MECVSYHLIYCPGNERKRQLREAKINGVVQQPGAEVSCHINTTLLSWWAFLEMVQGDSTNDDCLRLDVLTFKVTKRGRLHRMFHFQECIFI